LELPIAEEASVKVSERKAFFLGPKMRINRVLAELKIYDFS
jgi:hypothetical protein